MDTTTTIIGVCLLILTLAPIAWASYSTRLKEQKLQKTFDQLALMQNLKLTEWENIDGKLIGIDPVSKKLIFVSPRIPDGVTIALDKTNGFEVLKNKKDCQIELQSYGTSDQQISFFDNDKDDLLRFDFYSQKADHWLNLIRRVKISS
jgi:hypothetical protein